MSVDAHVSCIHRELKPTDWQRSMSTACSIVCFLPIFPLKSNCCQEGSQTLEGFHLYDNAFTIGHTPAPKNASAIWPHPWLLLSLTECQNIRGHVHMTSAKFSGFWTPSLPLSVPNPRNLSSSRQKLDTSLPPPLYWRHLWMASGDKYRDLRAHFTFGIKFRDSRNALHTG